MELFCSTCSAFWHLDEDFFLKKKIFSLSKSAPNSINMIVNLVREATYILWIIYLALHEYWAALQRDGINLEYSKSAQKEKRKKGQMIEAATLFQSLCGLACSLRTKTEGLA